MRKVISNTSPIILLLKINKLHILKELYGRIIITRAVFQEIEFGKNKLYYHNLALIDWIEIAKISNTPKKIHF